MKFIFNLFKKPETQKPDPTVKDPLGIAVRAILDDMDLRYGAVPEPSHGQPIKKF